MAAAELDASVGGMPIERLSEVLTPKALELNNEEREKLRVQDPQRYYLEPLHSSSKDSWKTTQRRTKAWLKRQEQKVLKARQLWEKQAKKKK